METPVLADQQRVIINPVCADTWCCLVALPRTMDFGTYGERERERAKERERARERERESKKDRERKKGEFLMSAQLDVETVARHDCKSWCRIKKNASCLFVAIEIMVL